MTKHKGKSEPYIVFVCDKDTFVVVGDFLAAFSTHTTLYSGLKYDCSFFLFFFNSTLRTIVR